MDGTVIVVPDSAYEVTEDVAPTLELEWADANPVHELPVSARQLTGQADGVGTATGALSIGGANLHIFEEVAQSLELEWADATVPDNEAFPISAATAVPVLEADDTVAPTLEFEWYGPADEPILPVSARPLTGQADGVGTATGTLTVAGTAFFVPEETAQSLEVDTESYPAIFQAAQDNEAIPVDGSIVCQTFKAAADTDDGYWEDGAGSGFINSHGDNFIGGGSGFGGAASAFSRFPSVTVPQGSTITSASLTWTSDTTYSVDTTQVTFRAVLEANPTAPTSNADAKARARTTAGVASGAIGHWVGGTIFTSPDLATVLQEVVNQGAFASGNAVVIYAIDAGSGATALRGFQAHDHGDPAVEPVLSICYTTATAVPAPPTILDDEGAAQIQPDFSADTAIIQAALDTEAIPVSGAFPVLEVHWIGDDEAAPQDALDLGAADAAIAQAQQDNEAIPVSGATPVLEVHWVEDVANGSLEPVAEFPDAALAQAAQDNEAIPVDGTPVVAPPVLDADDNVAAFIAPEEDRDVAIAMAAEVIPDTGAVVALEADDSVAQFLSPEESRDVAIAMAEEAIPVSNPPGDPPPPDVQDEVAQTLSLTWSAEWAVLTAISDTEFIPVSGLPPVVSSYPGPSGSATVAPYGPGGSATAAPVGPGGSTSVSRGPSGSATISPAGPGGSATTKTGPGGSGRVTG